MNSPKQNGFFVVIPAYNESASIEKVIGGVKKYTSNIIIVDDGSLDNTFFEAKKADANIILLQHKINLGKGATLKTGCLAAIKLGASVVVTMDADGQHDPDDIPKLTEKLYKDQLDIVFGSRILAGRAPFLRALGNKILTKSTKFLSNIALGDVLCGLRAFDTKIYEKLSWQSTGYAVEVEMIMNVGKNNLKYAEVPVKNIYP